MLKELLSHQSYDMTLIPFQVLDIANNIYKQLPENIDYEGTAKILAIDPCPLNVVLLQEVHALQAPQTLILRTPMMLVEDHS